MSEEKYISLKKTDWYIIISLVLLSFFIMAVHAYLPSKDVYFQVKYYKDSNEVIENVEPDKKSKLVIHGNIGNMIIEFDKERGAKVASSTCPCQVCVNSGWSKYDALVCVPNAVIIKPNKVDSDFNNCADAVTR